MSGHLNGCAAKFMEYAPRAHCYHCASHELNLALCKACKIPEISCMIADMQKKTGMFFKYSLKRQQHFEQSIERGVEQQKDALVSLRPKDRKIEN